MFSYVMDDLSDRLAGDLDSAFPDLVRAVQDDLCSGLRRLHGSEAEDIAQDALVRAYLALQGYAPDRIRELRLRAWIWTIALNLGRNRARDRARRPSLVELDDRHPTWDAEPADAAAWDRRLGGLPAVQRTAVVLRHVAGLGYGEIGEATGRPEGTVKADVHRGLERLRRMMEDEA